MSQQNLTHAGARTSKARQTEARKAALAEALRESGNISLACGAAGVDRRTHYRWINTDTAYRQDIAEALEEAGDHLEMEARNRAIVGWDEPVYQQGQLVGVIRRKSDTLLAMLLRGAKPEVYGNRLTVSQSTRYEHTPEPTAQEPPEMRQLSGADLLAAMKQHICQARLGKLNAGNLPK